MIADCSVAQKEAIDYGQLLCYVKKADLVLRVALLLLSSSTASPPLRAKQKGMPQAAKTRISAKIGAGRCITN
jgi:hypothetical protein